MRANEYQRKYDEQPPEPVDNTITLGTTPDASFDSSPDVAVDGSIDTGKGTEPDTNQQNTGLLSRLRNWLM